MNSTINSHPVSKKIGVGIGYQGGYQKAKIGLKSGYQGGNQSPLIPTLPPPLGGGGY